MPLGISGDAAVFAVIGRTIAGGGVPYLDVWDHKPPGIYLINGALAGLPLPLWQMIWLASVVAIAATGWCVYLLVASRVGRAGAIIVAALAVLTLGVYPVSVGGGMTETFAAALAAASFISAARGRWTAAGGLGAAAAATSLLALPVLLAVVVLAGRRIGSALLIGLGVAIVVLPLGTWLVATGAIGAAWDQVVVYNRAYVGAFTSNPLPRVVGLLVAPLPLIGLMAAHGARGWPSLDRAAIVWLAAAAGLLAFQGRTFEHYVAVVVVPLAILSAPAASTLQSRWQSRALLVACVSLTLTWGAVASADAIRHDDGPMQHALGEVAASHSRPGDRIVVWGSGAAVYVEAERVPATRYVHWAALITPGYSTPGEVHAWVSELEQHPPEVIVDAVAPHDYPTSSGPFRVPSAGDPSGRTLDLLAPFRAFVAARYERVSEIDGRGVYRLIQ